MELSSSPILCTKETLPTNVAVDNYDIPEMISKAILYSTLVDHELNQKNERIERANFDSSIRDYYMKRPDNAADSLYTLRQCNYLNPNEAVLHNIPANFIIDKEETEKTIKALLQKGLYHSTVQTIAEEKLALVDYYTELYQNAVDRLTPEEKQSSTVIEALRKQHLDFKVMPYVFMPIGAPPRHTEDGKFNYYALCTSIPQNVDDVLCKTYISHCIAYMLGEMEARCNVKKISLKRDIYYDFYIVADATLYFFLCLK